MKIAFFGVLAAGAVACAFRSEARGDDDPTTFEANPCATPDSSYVFHFVERPNSDCGPISDDLVVVTPEHQVVGWGVDCADRIRDGCTVKSLECKTHDHGRPCWTTKSFTYADDGASVSGLLEQACWSNGAWCHSLYDVTAARS